MSRERFSMSPETSAEEHRSLVEEAHKLLKEDDKLPSVSRGRGGRLTSEEKDTNERRNTIYTRLREIGGTLEQTGLVARIDFTSAEKDEDSPDRALIKELTGEDLAEGQVPADVLVDHGHKIMGTVDENDPNSYYILKAEGEQAETDITE